MAKVPAHGAVSRYNSSVAQPKPLPELPANVRDLADQHARVRAMLERWARQETVDEPDWEVADVERARFRSPPEAE